MAVFPRPERNPFLNDQVRGEALRPYGIIEYDGSAAGLREIRETLERALRQVRDVCSIPREVLYGGPRGGGMSDAVTDLVEIGGVWQLPPRFPAR